MAELSYGHNARRFSTGREAMDAANVMFKPCGCGAAPIAWDRSTGNVAVHSHWGPEARQLCDKPKTVHAYVSARYAVDGIHCPLPLKRDGVWIVPSFVAVMPSHAMSAQGRSGD